MAVASEPWASHIRHDEPRFLAPLTPDELTALREVAKGQMQGVISAEQSMNEARRAPTKQIKFASFCPSKPTQPWAVAGVNGTIEGERLSGQVLDGASDWQSVRNDGSTALNVRLVLKTEDDALIAMTYQGLRHGPPAVIARIEEGEVVDPTSYYFRINPLFETAAGQYDWINRVIAVGIGHRLPTARYTVSSRFCKWRRFQTVLPVILQTMGRQIRMRQSGDQ
jgi:Protein of unknown function (DUF3237)